VSTLPHGHADACRQTRSSLTDELDYPVFLGAELEIMKLHVRTKTDHLNTSDSVILIQPLSNWIYLALTVVGLLVATAMAAHLRYSDRKVVDGYVVPQDGIIKIYARTGGIVEGLFVRDGDSINAGAPAAVIGNKDISLDNGTNLSLALRQEGEVGANEKKKQLSNIERLRKLNSIEFEQRNLYLSDSLNQLLEQRKIAQQVLEQRKQNLARIDEPAYSSVISKLDRSRINQEYLEQRQKLLTTDASITRIRQDIAELHTARQKNEIALQDSLSALSVELSVLKQQHSRASANNKVLVHVPEAGTIASVRVHEGQSVTPSSLMMTLIPKSSDYCVELLVPSAAIGSIKAGQTVLLRFDAFPHEIYGFMTGKIKHVDEQTMSPEELADLTINPKMPVYKVTVGLQKQYVEYEGKQYRYRSGMIVNADILLEDRSLLSWILSPILLMKRAIN
jgi:membrane fusion protein